MRAIIFTIVAAALAGCGPSSLHQTGTSPMGGTRLADALAGRAAGSPLSCLPIVQGWRAEPVEGSALAFRSGSRRYVSSFRGGCPQAGRHGYAVVTTDRGHGLCSGDHAKVVDTSTGMIVDQCIVGPFIPYEALGKWN